MNFRVTIRPAANIDLAEARRIGLGDEFLASIAQAFATLEESPKQFPVYHHPFRRVLIERFPYKVFFTIDEDAEIVFRILHAARDHKWKLQ